MQRFEGSTERAAAAVDAALGPECTASEEAVRLARLEQAKEQDVAHREARAADLKQRFEAFAMRYVVLHSGLCVGVVVLLIYLEQLLPETGSFASELTGLAPRELRAVAFPTLTIVLSIACAGLFLLNMVRLGRMKRELTDITGSDDPLSP
jgi:hypothetical protein